MNGKAFVVLVLFSIFIIGCASSGQSGYATYNQPQGAPQGNQYVGGGCGVAPSAAYEDTPLAKIFNEVENF